MSIRWARYLALVIAVLVLGLGVACKGGVGGSGDDSADSKDDTQASDSTKSESDKAEEDSEDGEDDQEEAVPIDIAVLETGPIESILRFSTNLEAEREVQVFAEAARRVTQLLVEEGNDVQKGQVLVRLQDDEQRTALARTESQLAKARREYERQSYLHEQQLISNEIYNEATYNLEQLELALQDAQRQLGYTQVRAPISGTITARMVNVGNQINVNQHLFDIVDFNSIVARVYVPEKELHRLEPGQQARLFAEAGGAEARSGTVDRIAPRVDPRSGTVKATIAIPRSEGLIPGMYVTAELVTAIHEGAILVPKKALVYDGDQIFVFRLKDDNRVERLLIEAALEDRDNIEPAAGLEAGDRIVLAGQASLKDDSMVRIAGEKPAEEDEEKEEDGAAD